MSDATRNGNQTATGEPVDTELVTGAPQQPGASPVFAIRNPEKSTKQLAQNRMVVVSGAVIILAVAIFLFSFKPPHARVQSKKPDHATVKDLSKANGEAAEEQKSVSPVTESGTAAKAPQNDTINEDDVRKTAAHQVAAVPKADDKAIPKNAPLGALPPFDSQQGAWQAPPYRPGINSPELAPHADASRVDHDPDQASLVFVRKTNSGDAATQENLPDLTALPLAVGTRLRARLETAVSTAAKTPVIAVLEYNYEVDGEIVVSAGTKCIGHIEQADSLGYMSIRFEALVDPDGSTTSLNAVATDLSLRPVKGRVEGKNGGKNVLVRSFSGIGQMASLLVGRSGAGLSQAYSEDDALRERLSNNIGMSADQELTKLVSTNHIVVSIPANTDIYVVVDRSTASLGAAAGNSVRQAPTTSQIESLKQLLQLQRELNANAQMVSH